MGGGAQASLRKGRGWASLKQQLLSFVADRQPSFHTKTLSCHRPVWSLDFPPEFVERPFLWTRPDTPHRWVGQLLQWGVQSSPRPLSVLHPVEEVPWPGQEASASGLDSIPRQSFLANLKVLAHLIRMAFHSLDLYIFICRRKGKFVNFFWSSIVFV